MYSSPCLVIFSLIYYNQIVNGFDLSCGSINSMEDLQNAGMEAGCAEDLFKFMANLKNNTLWAVEMWESTAKEISGSLHGTNYQLGNFDECLIPIRNSDISKPNGIARQYCLAKIVFNNTYPKNYMSDVSIFDPETNIEDRIFANGDPSRIERDVLYSAMCLPASCSVEDLNILLTIGKDWFHIINKLNISYTVSIGDSSCQTDQTNVPYTTGAMVMIIILCVLTILEVISTVSHWYTIRTDSSCPDFIKCFSIIQHVRQLSKKGDKDKELEVLYGIRVVAMFIVIMEHRVGSTAQGPLVNREEVEALYRNWEGNFILQTEMFVDTFFALSGLLTIYQLLKHSEKRTMHYIQIIFLRYIRLMLLYVFVIFLTATLLSQSGQGPLWNVVMGQEATYCQENWWTNILMINNYVNIERMCMVHAWYIPCDFHFFIISLILCAALKNRKSIGLALAGVFLVFSIIIPGLITYFLELPAMLGFYNEFLVNPRADAVFQNIYIKSHTRLAPYILGFFTGYIVYKYYKPGKRRFSVTYSLITCLCIIVAYLIVVFSTEYFLERGQTYNVLRSSLYAGLQRPIRCCVICACLAVLIFGEIPLIQNILGWFPCIVLGKLTYGAYLVHMGFQLRVAASIRSPVYFNGYSLVQLTVADAVISFVFSFVGYLLIEGPPNYILRMIFTPKQRKSDDLNIKQGNFNEALEIDGPNEKHNHNMRTVL